MVTPAITRNEGVPGSSPGVGSKSPAKRTLLSSVQATNYVLERGRFAIRGLFERFWPTGEAEHWADGEAEHRVGRPFGLVLSFAASLPAGEHGFAAIRSVVATAGGLWTSVQRSGVRHRDDEAAAFGQEQSSGKLQPTRLLLVRSGRCLAGSACSHSHESETLVDAALALIFASVAVDHVRSLGAGKASSLTTSTGSLLNSRPASVLARSRALARRWEVAASDTP
jgi:hypothetical protein